MEKILMSEIDKEIEDLKEQIKDLLEVNTSIGYYICKLREDVYLYKNLEEIVEYKNHRLRFHLQSKVYDSVAYGIDYDNEIQFCSLTIELKPDEFVKFASEEKYKFGIYAVEEFPRLNIQWKNRNTGTNITNINANNWSIFEKEWELTLHSPFSVKDKEVKNIFKKGFIEEISVKVQ